MSKFDPMISQTERVRLRGWKDGDISLVFGTVRVFDAATMSWPKVSRDSIPFQLPTDPDFIGTWRADGSAYRERHILSEDVSSFKVGGRSVMHSRGASVLCDLPRKGSGEV